jgi:hypothetical protein
LCRSRSARGWSASNPAGTRLDCSPPTSNSFSALQFGHGRLQLLSLALIQHGRPVGLQQGLGEFVVADVQSSSLRVHEEVETGAFALALAFPEVGADMALVGRFVFGEADVAVDAHQRPTVRPWVVADSWEDGSQPLPASPRRPEPGAAGSLHSPTYAPRTKPCCCSPHLAEKLRSPRGNQ